MNNPSNNSAPLPDLGATKPTGHDQVPPATPAPEFPWPARLNVVINYLIDYWGLPPITAKTMVLNAIGTVMGAAVKVRWNNFDTSPSLTLVIGPAVVEEHHGWAGFMAKPLQDEIYRLQEASRNMPHHAIYEAVRFKPDKPDPVPDSDPKKVKPDNKALQAERPWLMLRIPPREHSLDILSSCLVLDDTGGILQYALLDTYSSTSVTKLDQLSFLDLYWRQFYYGAIIEAPPDGWARALKTRSTRRWQPIFLPGAKGALSKRVGTPERKIVDKAWADEIAQALAVRYGPSRLFQPTDGYRVVDHIFAFAEQNFKAPRFRGKFRWATAATVKLAAVFQMLLDGQSTQIQPAAWDAAEAHMVELIKSHAGVIKAGPSGVNIPKAVNGRKGDRSFLRDYLRLHEGDSNREILRGLPKRRKNYWNELMKDIGAPPPVDAPDPAAKKNRPINMNPLRKPGPQMR